MKDREAAMQAENERLREQLTTQSSEATMLPLALTAENGAKSLLAGEFCETLEVEDADGNVLDLEVPVTWTTIKAIYARIVAHYSTTQQAPRVNRDDLAAVADMVRRS